MRFRLPLPATLLVALACAAVPALSAARPAPIRAAATPQIFGISPARGEQGASLTLVLQGTRFEHGATVSLGEGISVTEAVVSGRGVRALLDHILTLRIEIAADAEPGPRDVTVTNPGGETAVAPAAFEVVAPPPVPRPDLAGTWKKVKVRSIPGRRGAEGSTLFTGTLQVANSGAAAARSFVVRFVAAETADGEGALPLGKPKKVAHRLKPGARHTVKLKARLPRSALDPTGKYLLALLDSTDRVEEGDEQNNAVAFALPVP
ncbi:MAG: CARDB domain-containing protein [Armatimonadota bacterium]